MPKLSPTLPFDLLPEEAKNFYLALGFDASPLEPMTLMITLNDLRACIAQ
jgi:hypothetical protein